MPQPDGWETIAPYAELRLDETDLVLCHYPFRRWKGMHRGSVNRHGHRHGRLKPLLRQFDVDADVRDFRPGTLSVLLPRRANGGDAQTPLATDGMCNAIA